MIACAGNLTEHAAGTGIAFKKTKDMKRHFKIIVDGVIFTHPTEHPSLPERLAMYKDMKERKQFFLMLWR